MEHFLTKNEREEIKRVQADRFDLIGLVSYDDPEAETFFQKNLRVALQKFPVTWPNSSDLLYAMPYDRDDFMTVIKREQKDERRRREESGELDSTQQWKQKPWTYQDGMIFEARLIRESAKALLLKFSFGSAWVPKSQIDWEPNHVWLPEWLIKDKGLTKADAIEEIVFEWEPSLLKLGKFNKPARNKMRRIKPNEVL